MGRRRRSSAGQAKRDPLRRRIAEHEKPGSVLRGPRITVVCECGEGHALFYGERWQCPACGRTYDSSRIPRAEYEQVRRTQRRFRALPILFGLLIAGVAVIFTLTGNVFSVFFLLPLGIMVWFVFLRPVHRRRYYAATEELPSWNLRAE